MTGQGATTEKGLFGRLNCCSQGLFESFPRASWGLPEGFLLTGVCASMEEVFLGAGNCCS